MQAGEFGRVGAAGQRARVAVDLFVELAERAVGGAEPQVVVVGVEPGRLRGGDVARGERRPQLRRPRACTAFACALGVGAVLGDRLA